MAFSAVLLAGGKSSRMGRDKAGVLVGGEPLWQRQLSTLRRVSPAELFISGKADAVYRVSGVAIVEDITPERGPLSGLEASLNHASYPLVLVLAIDLPAMTSDFLARLVGAAAEGGAGVVARRDGWFEPLAAVYPRTCLSLVEECVRGEDRSMQAFIQRALAADFLRPIELTAPDAALFVNVNTPADLETTNP